MGAASISSRSLFFCSLFGFLVVDESTFARVCVSLLDDVYPFVSQHVSVAAFFLMSFVCGFFNTLLKSATSTNTGQAAPSKDKTTSLIFRREFPAVSSLIPFQEDHGSYLSSTGNQHIQGDGRNGVPFRVACVEVSHADTPLRLSVFGWERSKPLPTQVA